MSKTLASSRSGKKARFWLPACISAFTLAMAGQASALPNPPQGYEDVFAYYADAAGTQLIGWKVVVNRCDPNQPQILPTYGSQSGYMRVEVIQCGQMPSGTLGSPPAARPLFRRL